MGDDKWTHREPGSISGSVVPPPVPPPVAPEELAPSRSPLPRRKPKSDRRGGHAVGADGGEPPVASSPAAPGPAEPGPAEPGPAEPRPAEPPSTGFPPAESAKTASSPAGQRKLQLAEQSTAAATSPQLPDNVRYLFRPVLNEPADPATAAKSGTTPEAPTISGRRASLPLPPPIGSPGQTRRPTPHQPTPSGAGTCRGPQPSSSSGQPPSVPPLRSSITGRRPAA